MTPKFLAERYLSENTDVAEGLNGASFSAAEHYEQYGRVELRGYNDTGGTYNVETVSLCLDGHVFLTGWLNRKLHQNFDFVIRIGYQEFVIPREAFAFYRRDDISEHLREPGLRGAFVCLFSVGGALRANTVSFRLARHEISTPRPAHPKSPEAFFQEALTQLAFLTSYPPSATHNVGQFLTRALTPVWRKYLDNIKFTEVYTSTKLSAQATPALSFLTVLYKDTTLLKPQLLLMSQALPRSDVEWLYVINKCGNLEEVLRDIAALDQLVPFSLRVIVASENSGFSHANNFGAAQTRAPRVAFVNPDIFPAPGLEKTLDGLLNVPLPLKVLVGSQLSYGNGALMHDGMYIAENASYNEETASAMSLLRVEHFGKDARAHAGSNQPRMRNVPAVSGAFWQFQRETLLNLGGLSTDYFLAHYEDADFCLRLWEQGGQVRVFGPSALLHHEGVGSHSSPIGLTTRWLNRHIFSDRWRDSYKAIMAGANVNVEKS